MKVPNSFLSASSPILKVAIALSAVCYLMPASAHAQPAPICTPVAYLFRHAEEYDGRIPGNINDNTLRPEGKRHAALYADMIVNFQKKLGYCPLLDVFAMARKNAPNVTPVFNRNGVGSTNPFFTGKPLTNAVALELECAANLRLGCNQSEEFLNRDIYSPITSTNPMVREEVNVPQTGDILYEFLPYTSTRDDIREIVKDAVESDHSVAFFWGSQGFNEPAKVLGIQVPAYQKNPNSYKAPRNSVFVFSNYNPTSAAETGAKVLGKFTTLSATTADPLDTGRFIQCFNYAPGKGFDAKFPKTNQIAFYCKRNEILTNYAIPSAELHLLKGAICDSTKVVNYNNDGSYVGYGIEDGIQCF